MGDGWPESINHSEFVISQFYSHYICIYVYIYMYPIIYAHYIVTYPIIPYWPWHMWAFPTAWLQHLPFVLVARWGRRKVAQYRQRIKGRAVSNLWNFNKKKSMIFYITSIWLSREWWGFSIYGIPHIPFGKHTKNHGKSHLLMGKPTISMVIFNS
jgi:hypothetical protein